MSCAAIGWMEARNDHWSGNPLPVDWVVQREVVARFDA
jgi:hypothetical protein